MLSLNHIRSQATRIKKLINKTQGLRLKKFEVEHHEMLIEEWVLSG